jgi:hypothetical protein
MVICLEHKDSMNIPNERSNANDKQRNIFGKSFSFYELANIATINKIAKNINDKKVDFIH